MAEVVPSVTLLEKLRKLAAGYRAAFNPESPCEVYPRIGEVHTKIEGDWTLHLYGCGSASVNFRACPFLHIRHDGFWYQYSSSVDPNALDWFADTVENLNPNWWAICNWPIRNHSSELICGEDLIKNVRRLLIGLDIAHDPQLPLNLVVGLTRNWRLYMWADPAKAELCHKGKSYVTVSHDEPPDKHLPWPNEDEFVELIRRLEGLDPDWRAICSW